MTAIKPIACCLCCGSRDLVAKKILWPALARDWALSQSEIEYVDRQQGLQCVKCGSSLRSMALALAICRCYGYNGLFKDFVGDFKARNLRVLEINEAGQLTPFLGRFPKHTIVRYPETDMTRMSIPEASYDLVVHSDTLEHVPSPVGALSECYRVLAPGGFCAYTVPMIVGRLTRSRAGMPPSYHGNSDERSADFMVQTEYGCDAWRDLILAGFQECRLVTPEFPSALALIGVRWS